MLRETSTTMSITIPLRFTSVDSIPHCGRARAIRHKMSTSALKTGMARYSRVLNDGGKAVNPCVAGYEITAGRCQRQLTQTNSGAHMRPSNA